MAEPRSAQDRRRRAERVAERRLRRRDREVLDAAAQTLARASLAITLACHDEAQAARSAA